MIGCHVELDNNSSLVVVGQLGISVGEKLESYCIPCVKINSK